ncbi:hypothetical protein HDU96_008054 [Phlyctochytrium bullatum]|nr:hypothetical protein HDU96_008054 [Phlyctochytrium bullatum]
MNTSGSEHEPLLSNGAPAETAPLKKRPHSRRLTTQWILALIALAGVVVLGSAYVASLPEWAEWFRKHFPFLFPGKGGEEPGEEPLSPFGWKKCADIDNDHLRCGEIFVPFDYNNLTAGTFSVALVRYRAPASEEAKTAKPRKRISVLVNPGGPGGSGVGWVKAAGRNLHEFIATPEPRDTDSEPAPLIDVIGFDPRGIGESHPVLCFDSSFAHSNFFNSLSAIGTPVGEGSRVSLQAFSAFYKARGESCRRHDGLQAGGKKLPGGFLKYVSTALTARDMDLIRENLGEEVLNFYGASYGTYLGATYVNMFPDHVGRVIIDGVVNPVHFSGTKSDMFAGSVLHLEHILDLFGAQCEKAGPTHCALAAPSKASGIPVAKLLRRSVARLGAHPLPVPDLPVPVVLTGDSAAQVLFRSAYGPASWPLVARALAALNLHEGDDDLAPHPDTASGKPLALMLGASVIEEDAEDRVCRLPEKDTSGPDGFNAVYCNDSEDERDAPLEKWAEWAKRSEEVSPLGGARFFYGAAFGCKDWPARPVERFTGPWNHTLKNKILIIGNTEDPVTPLESARVVESLLTRDNSILLTHRAAGHCSLSQPGLCTIRKVRRYIQHGELPAPETVCDHDFPAFPGGELMALSVGEAETVRSVAEVHEGVMKASAVRW